MKNKKNRLIDWIVGSDGVTSMGEDSEARVVKETMSEK